LSYLEPSTLRPMISVCEGALVARHVTALLDRGYTALLDGRRVDDLKRLYGLCARVERVDDLKKRFADHCKVGRPRRCGLGLGLTGGGRGHDVCGVSVASLGRRPSLAAS